LAKTKTLIIGGAGAIGSYLSKELSENNHDVTIIDNLSSGHYELIKDLNVSFIKHDIVEPITMEPDFEVIIQAAAFFANQNSVEHPIDDLRTNGIGMINCLEFAKENRDLKKFIYLSSSCVYGNKYNQSENAKIEILDTPYAITKYIGEKYCEYYNENYKIPIIVLRLFNSFGPGEIPGKYRNVIPNFIEDIINNNHITITGSGEETRDFTSVKDIVQAILLSIEYQISFDIFNVGTGIETSINEIALILESISNKRIIIEKKDRRVWDSISRRKANIEKIHNLLGYISHTTLDRDLKETFEWHFKRKHG
jgi:nucleoside-diphosphate-sugar epimerase